MIEREWSKLDFLLHVIVLCPPTNHRSDLRSDLGLMTENFCSDTHTMKKRTDSRRSMQKDIKDKITIPRETRETRETHQ